MHGVRAVAAAGQFTGDAVRAEEFERAGVQHDRSGAAGDAFGAAAGVGEDDARAVPAELGGEGQARGPGTDDQYIRSYRVDRHRRAPFIRDRRTLASNYVRASAALPGYVP
ncbi:hypothetical protein Pen01_15520 [Phytomonospora endophytica]|nr:hypothetical protein Pen01_15520 [Phytomonospora endophytica]